MGVLIFLFVMAILVGQIAIALEFKEIAAYKGYEHPKYFWYIICLGIFGMLLVIALPNKNFENTVKKDELKEVSIEDLPTL